MWSTYLWTGIDRGFAGSCLFAGFGLRVKGTRIWETPGSPHLFASYQTTHVPQNIQT